MLALAGGAACGHGTSSPPAVRHDAEAVARDAAPVELPVRPLGLADVSAFGWRKRAGHAAYRLARKAEARGDWAGVVTACRQALAADPGHLEASYLLAIGLAKTGQLDQVLGPLQLAAAGDYGKWATASLDQPALAGFRATPTGEAWQRRVEHDREVYVGALARGLLVIAAGDLYAVDLAAPRWYPLTRTHGGVVGVFEPPRAAKATTLVYIVRTRGGASKESRYALGLIDLATGVTTPVSELPVGDIVHVAWSRKLGGPLVRTAKAMLAFDGAGKPVAAPAHPDPLGDTWLDVTGRRAKLRHGELGPDAKADWDDQGLASAMRLAASSRIVTVPSPGLIDGYTVTWSHDHAHVAFVAQLDDHCAHDTANTAAFVADGGTGALVELERAKGGLALAWLDDAHVAIAGDHGVGIAELAGAGQPHPIAGADGLIAPRVRPRCTPEPAGPDEPGGEQDPADPGNDDPR
jgi:hypothetical protein